MAYTSMAGARAEHVPAELVAVERMHSRLDDPDAGAMEQRSQAILPGLHQAGVEFVVVGGLAAVLQGAPIVTEDLDIVHRRTPQNVARLLSFLLSHGAYAFRCGCSVFPG